MMLWSHWDSLKHHLYRLLARCLLPISRFEDARNDEALEEPSENDLHDQYHISCPVYAYLMLVPALTAFAQSQTQTWICLAESYSLDVVFN